MDAIPRKSWHFPLVFRYRYYQQHFLDDIRQAAIDISLGYSIDTDQLNIDWSHYLDILDNCCLDLIPAKPPKIELQLNTHPDILYATAMYNLTRFVIYIANASSRLLLTQSFRNPTIFLQLKSRVFILCSFRPFKPYLPF